MSSWEGTRRGLLRWVVIMGRLLYLAGLAHTLRGSFRPERQRLREGWRIINSGPARNRPRPGFPDSGAACLLTVTAETRCHRPKSGSAGRWRLGAGGPVIMSQALAALRPRRNIRQNVRRPLVAFAPGTFPGDPAGALRRGLLSLRPRAIGAGGPVPSGLSRHHNGRAGQPPRAPDQGRYPQTLRRVLIVGPEWLRGADAPPLRMERSRGRGILISRARTPAAFLSTPPTKLSPRAGLNRAFGHGPDLGAARRCLGWPCGHRLSGAKTTGSGPPCGGRDPGRMESLPCLRVPQLLYGAPASSSYTRAARYPLAARKIGRMMRGTCGRVRPPDVSPTSVSALAGLLWVQVLCFGSVSIVHRCHLPACSGAEVVARPTICVASLAPGITALLLSWQRSCTLARTLRFSDRRLLKSRPVTSWIYYQNKG